MRPPTNGSKGEVAMMQALQAAKIEFQWQVPIKTRFSVSTFLCDFLIPMTYAYPELNRVGLVLEVDGGLHRHNWGGSPAKSRIDKDHAKDECLKAEGYRVLRVTDTEVKKDPDGVIARIRKELES